MQLLLLLVCFESCFQQSKAQSKTNEDGIRTASMTEVGIDSGIINRIDTTIQNGTYPNIHSLLIARHNMLVYEKYWTGRDEDWGSDRGVLKHSKDDLHDIRSISKSIVSACIGIAIQQGKIKSVDQKVFDFFPEYAKLDTGMKSLLTIKHLLTMSSGLSWNEEVPYDNPENSEIKMVRSSNPVEYVLRQPMDFPPGKVWKYNGGTTQLLAAIIEKTTGKQVDQFAKENLFDPLGIKRFEWRQYPGTNLPAAASGLRLRSRDLLKFGLLYSNEGTWNGKQLVPKSWVRESCQAHVERPTSGAYGYQFWLWHDTINHKLTSLVACVGNGDQRIFFDKTNDLLIVVTAGNYNKWDIKNNSGALLKNYVYAALKR
ncbi:MAG: serine hydrolase [Bacteroidetes bacterium]|nr:MAG: serine hydrolase [Bacteroidota bacterium]